MKSKFSFELSSIPMYVVFQLKSIRSLTCEPESERLCKY